MQTLQASLRVHVVGIAILFCLTLAFVTLTSVGAAERIFFAFFCIVSTGVLLAVYRKESALAEGRFVASGTVTELKSGRRRSRNIKYQFVAFDGKQYRGEGSIGSLQRMQAGSEVLVLYKPLEPSVNLPVPSFLFYSFSTT